MTTLSASADPVDASEAHVRNGELTLLLQLDGAAEWIFSDAVVGVTVRADFGEAIPISHAQ